MRVCQRVRQLEMKALIEGTQACQNCKMQKGGERKGVNAPFYLKAPPLCFTVSTLVCFC